MLWLSDITIFLCDIPFFLKIHCADIIEIN